MPANKSWGEHGTMRRYRQGGCDDTRGGRAGNGPRCDECKLASREFNQGRRAGIVNPVHGNVLPLDKRRRSAKKAENKGNSGLSSVKTGQNSTQAQPSKPPKSMGATESAVFKQLEQFREAQPVRFEMALNAARILDDAERVTLHNQASRQLDAIVEKLTGGRRTKSKGRLASIQRMTAKAR